MRPVDDAAAIGERPPAERLEWAVTPYRDRPGRTVIVAAVIASVAAGAFAAFRDPFLTALAALLLVGSLRPFFARTEYVLDAEGISMRRGWTRSRRKWDDFRSHYADRHGVTLSPFAEASWLESYRGMRLLLAANREEVLRFVAARVPAGPPRKNGWSIRLKTRR